MCPVIDWREGHVPYSVQFKDSYYSRDNGLEESRHVFLAGNNLPQQFCPGFHIAELGFGTGLNLLMAWQAWKECGVKGPLRFTSFEAYPLTKKDMKRALASFEEIGPLAESLLSSWDKGRKSDTFPSLIFEVILGDARQTVPKWNGQADCWFLDGFAPTSNPEMWEQELMVSVAEHTALGGTFATFTSAGKVRRSLSHAGFLVKRIPGFGGKRHMSVGKRVMKG